MSFVPLVRNVTRRAAGETTEADRRYFSSIFGWTGSLIVHAVFFALASLALRPLVPIPISLQVPTTLDFSVASLEDRNVLPGRGGSARAFIPVAAIKRSAPKIVAIKKRLASARERISTNKVAPVDAGAASVNAPRDQEAVNAPGDAGADDEANWGYGGDGQGTGFGDGSGPGGGGGFLGLRFDTAQLQQSALVLEIEALLSIIPGWREALSGSGIEALDVLDRVFVGSSNLRPSHLVVVGRFRLGRAALEEVMGRMAQARGQPFAWKEEGDVRTAAWPSAKPTPRAVADLGQGAFIVSQPQDLAAALYVARVFQRLWDDSAAVGPPANILDLPSGEAVELSVEGVRHFATMPKRMAPARFKISVRPVDQFSVDATAAAQYSSPRAAENAATFLGKKLEELARHPTAQYLGISTALSDTRVATRDKSVEATSRLTLHQLRALLGFVSQAIESVGKTLR